MCGIATLAFGRGLRRRVPYPLVRRLVAQLLVELQARGTDASGIAIINEGAESRVFKKPLQAARLVVRPVFDDMLQSIGPQTNFVMLHTRSGTVGRSANNFNNHPIVVEPVVGIHNGTLWNDFRLFKRFSDYFEQEGSVDSEIIFKLFLHFIDGGSAPCDALRKTTDLLVGAFTGALVDMRRPHQMLMFKNSRPLSVFRFHHYDLVVTTSGGDFFQRAAKRVGFKAQSKHEEVEDGTGLYFDVDQYKRITNSLVDFHIPAEPEYVSQTRPWLLGIA